MNAKGLFSEISKSKRFLPADLDDVDVIFSNNNGEISFFFIKDEEILHKFTLKEVN